MHRVSVICRCRLVYTRYTYCCNYRAGMVIDIKWRGWVVQIMMEVHYDTCATSRVERAHC
jgi:hypothetical protein